MRWLDGKTSYGWISIVLHWFAAIAVVTQWSIGQTFENLPDGDDKLALFRLHLAIGGAVAPILLARVLARVLQGGMHTLPQTQPFAFIAAATHWGMLICIALLAISGPLSEFWAGRGIDTFLGIHIPTPFTANEGLEKMAGAVHHNAVTAITVLVTLHLLGVAKHMFVDRDSIVLRMIRPARSKD